MVAFIGTSIEVNEAVKRKKKFMEGQRILYCKEKFSFFYVEKIQRKSNPTIAIEHLYIYFL